MQILMRAVTATRRHRALAPSCSTELLTGQPFAPWRGVQRARPVAAMPPASAASGTMMPSLAELESPADRQRRFRWPSLEQWCALRTW
jgi:hypothetical protein